MAVRRSSQLWIDTEGHRVAYAHLFVAPILPMAVADGVVVLGSTEVFVLCLVWIVIAALILEDRFLVIVTVLAGPLALIATEVIGKPLVARREGNGLGFPSGHTTAIATSVTLVALAGYRHSRGRGLRIVSPAALLVPLMGLSLVRLHDHLFSDTIAGGLVGCGAVLGVAWIVSSVVSAAGRTMPPSRTALGQFLRFYEETDIIVR